VLDRAVAILDAVEAGARSFTELVEATGYSRSTTHRLLRALEHHGLLASVEGVGYVLGPHLLRLASGASDRQPLRDMARPILERLAEETGESAQLFVRSGDHRLCVVSVQSSSELRTIVEPGATLPLTAGSGGKVLLAWAPDADGIVSGAEPLTAATPSAERLRRQLPAIVRRGWAESVGEREGGVASVSAPVFAEDGGLIAAVSVSGPIHRLGRSPGKRHSAEVLAAARDIERALRGG
jgi:DNA-binding IclR family transcriptional regulator